MVNIITKEIKNRMKGCFFGLAIGDAMGGPYQFKFNFQVELIKEYNEGGLLNLRKGEYSDDTSMALCISKSIIECKDLDLQDLNTKFYNWTKDGYLSTRNIGFDIGNTIKANVLKNLDNNNLNNIKIDEESRNWANGGIMRLAPIPIKYFNDNQLINKIIDSTKITHNSKVCIDSNIVFGQLIVNAFNGKSKENLFDGIKFEKIDYRVNQRFFKFIDEDYEPEVYPTGNVLDCVELTMYAIYKFDNFIDGLLWLLQFGNDSNTVGAIYGQLAGAIYGYDQIPEYYKENIMNKDLLENIFEELLNTELNIKQNFIAKFF